MAGDQIQIDGLVKTYGRNRAVDGITFSAPTGITGLLGPNGAGKTTLLRILATVLSPDQGAIRLLGLDPERGDSRILIRRELGYMPQDPGLHRNFTAFEFLDYIAILKEIDNRASRHAEVTQRLQEVGLEDVANRKIRNLSGGMRRRVALAQALLGEPKLLLLDEPTAGLDPEQRLRFRELISRIAENRTVLLSTHQTEDVAALCRKVVVMNRGVRLFEGAPRELSAIAAGHIWLAEERAIQARLSWRTGDGVYRNIGDPPDDVTLEEPSVEDGYLLLVGDDALKEAA